MNFDDLIDDLEEQEKLINKDSDLDDPIDDDPEPTPPGNTGDEPIYDDPTPPTPDPTDTDDGDENYEGYFNLLKQVGALDLPEDFTFDNTPEGLEKALEVTKNQTRAKAANDILEALPDAFKPLLEYGLKGGTSLEKFLQAHAPIDYDSLDLSDTENQKRVMREYYQSTSNHPAARIERMINNLESTGDLETEALSTLDELKQLTELRKSKLLQEAELENQRRQDQAQQEIQEFTTKIEGLSEADPTRKARLKSFLLAPIKVENQVTTQFDSALNQVLNNPDHLIQLADILADYNPSVGFQFDRLEKKLKSKSVSAFKQIVDDTLKVPKGGRAQKQLDENFD